MASRETRRLLASRHAPRSPTMVAAKVGS